LEHKKLLFQNVVLIIALALERLAGGFEFVFDVTLLFAALSKLAVDLLVVLLNALDLGLQVLQQALRVTQRHRVLV